LCSNSCIYSSSRSIGYNDNRGFRVGEKGDELHFGKIWRRLFYGQLVIYIAETKAKQRDNPRMFEDSMPQIKNAKKLMGAPSTKILGLTAV